MKFFIILAMLFLFHTTARGQTENQYDILSFNIQFLGHFKDKKNTVLAEIVSDYDLVFIQELVAPPFSGTFPDGTPFKADAEAEAFFVAMKAKGFEFVLSPEDTGTDISNHKNSSATEWWVAFYKPDRVLPAEALPNGFLAKDRSDHDDYERVPYAFAFKFGGANDLVFISTHLKPGGGTSGRSRRAVELGAIYDYVKANDATEKDFIILGDMNIKNCNELKTATPPEFLSLNSTCRPTNTSPRSPKPYDHVMYRPQFSSAEIDSDFGLKIVDLIEAVHPFWNGSE